MDDLDHLKPFIDRLTYINYASNRDFAPEVSPERWGRIFPNVPEMEAMYQAEKAINKARQQ
jgi:hypothetical protein